MSTTSDQGNGLVAVITGASSGIGEGHDDHRRMIEANLLGAITVTEAFLDQLIDGGGDLVNLSSVAGRTARPGNAVYAATKWGLTSVIDPEKDAPAGHSGGGDDGGEDGGGHVGGGGDE